MILLETTLNAPGARRKEFAKRDLPGGQANIAALKRIQPPRIPLPASNDSLNNGASPVEVQPPRIESSDALDQSLNRR